MEFLTGSYKTILSKKKWIDSKSMEKVPGLKKIYHANYGSLYQHNLGTQFAKGSGSQRREGSIGS